MPETDLVDLEPVASEDLAALVVPVATLKEEPASESDWAVPSVAAAVLELTQRAPAALAASAVLAELAPVLPVLVVTLTAQRSSTMAT